MSTIKSKAAFIAAAIAVSLVILLAVCLVIYAFTGSVTQYQILPGYSNSGIVVSYVPEEAAALYETGMIVSSDDVPHEDHEHEADDVHAHDETGVISHVGTVPATYEEIVSSLGVDDAAAASLGIQDGYIQLTMVVFGAPDGLIEVRIETGTVRPIDLLFH